MDFQKQYVEKRGSLADMLSMLKDGDVICGGGELYEPQLFYENFHRILPEPRDIELLKGKRGSGYVYPFMEMPGLADHITEWTLRNCLYKPEQRFFSHRKNQRTL